MSDKKKVDYVCSHCGSDEVQVDAYAVWYPEEQCFDVANTFDDWVCEQCGGECSVTEIPWNE